MTRKVPKQTVFALKVKHMLAVVVDKMWSR